MLTLKSWSRNADDAVTYCAQDARPSATDECCHPQNQRCGGEQTRQRCMNGVRK